jgi:FAD/FMN-containing dehydrogenase
MAAEVIEAGSARYEAVRRSQNARFDGVRPQAVVRCHTAADVVEALAFARRHGAPIAVRSGGHCFAGRSSTEGVVIDVGPMDSVSVQDGLATVGAGVTLGGIYDALEPHGLAIAGGCGPTVGIAGLTLGGGLGILGRRYGLTCDQLVTAEVVLADGRIVTCDDDHEEDLFWALRGAGGGQFGVVTSLTLKTVPAPTVTCFDLTWPHDQASALIDAWQHHAPDAPDDTAASLLATAAAARPPVLHLFGAAAAMRDLLDRFPQPAAGTLVELPFREAKGWLAANGPGPDDEGHHVYSKSEFFRQPLPAAAGTELVDHFASGRHPRELDFSPWSGAYNRVPTAATAFPHRAERFLLKQAVAGEAGRDWLQRSWEITHPHGSGGVYVNFPDPELPDPRAYHRSNYDRLRQVKARYDAENVFRFPQSL